MQMTADKLKELWCCGEQLSMLIIHALIGVITYKYSCTAKYSVQLSFKFAVLDICDIVTFVIDAEWE